MVLAASSLQPWLSASLPPFELDASFGGSHMLLQQARQSPRVELLLLAFAADPPEGFSSAVAWGSNQLALVARAGNCTPEDLRPTARLALGDPKLAPIGEYAEAALQSLKKSPVRCYTRDDRSALTLLDSGHADLAIVYRSDLRGRAFYPLPGPPMTYYRLQRKEIGAATQAFVAWMDSPEGRQKLKEFGLGQ